mmetsp:Transcript_74663/g.230784  ORF Transcript_74663/g.230784 Transcript_74663/m.230784 type:complete len:204 (-) Transcript_74663:64-675(-)
MCASRPLMVALRAALLLAASSHMAEADSALEILGKLKTFRDGASELFGSAAGVLREKGQAKDAETVQKWSDDWLSVLGVSRGLTGLAKDFVLGYLGRSAYHDSNGPLIETIKRVSAVLPEGGSSIDEDDVASLKYGVLDVCKEGKKLFKEGGSLHQMLDELQTVLRLEGIVAALQKGLNENSRFGKAAFDYLAGPKPSTAGEL